MNNNLQSLIVKLRSGELDLLAYLDWLEARFAEREPDLLAFVPENGRFQRLRQDAEALLHQYPHSENRPPLFGIPLAVKDIFHVDGFQTHAGSTLPVETLKGPESPAVTELKRAGALILGKSVTTEFAYFGPGPTRNPHHPGHTPGGSSSGSAAAVGAQLSPLALGTQTIGSINRPAAFCGVVGYKPSYDRISRAGVIPLSPSLDHVGFFTPTMAGVDMVAELLCQNWHLVFTNRKPVLGIPDSPYLHRAQPEGLTHFMNTADRLVTAGFTVKSVKVMPNFDAIYQRHQLIVAAEAARVHAQWFALYGDCYHPKTVELIERGQAVSDEALMKAQNGRFQLRDELSRIMNVQGIDLWIAPPATGPAPAGLESTGDPVMNLPWTHAGLPTITLPVDKNEKGLPLGLQVIGRWYQDEALIAWCHELETALSA